jgi:putative membrane protein
MSLVRFKLMERRLYYGITWPAALLTTGFGLSLIGYNLHYYLKAHWMHAKFSLVILLWIYHLSCGHFLKLFAKDLNTHTAFFYRLMNEIPTLLLILIVLLVEVKPFR